MRSPINTVLAASCILLAAVVTASSVACMTDEPKVAVAEVDLESLAEQWASVGIQMTDVSCSSPELDAAARSWIEVDASSHTISEAPDGENPKASSAASQLGQPLFFESVLTSEVAVTVVGLRTGFIFDTDAQSWFAEIDIAFQGPRKDVLRFANRLVPRFFDSAKGYMELRDDRGAIVELSPSLRERECTYADMNITFKPAGFYVEELPSGSIRLLQPLPVPLLEKPELGIYSVRIDAQEFERVWRMGGTADRALRVDTSRGTHRMKHTMLTVPRLPDEP